MAPGSGGAPRRSTSIVHLWSGCEPKDTLRIDLYDPLPPATVEKHQLPDGQSIQELVGDDDGRTLRHLTERLVPGNRQRVPLPPCGGAPGRERLPLRLA